MKDAKIIDLLNKKKQRLNSLNLKYNEIDEIDIELFTSTFRKSLGNVGNKVKGFIFIGLGIALLLVSVILLYSPSTLYEHVPYIDTPDQIATNQISKSLDNIKLPEMDVAEIHKSIKSDIESRYHKNIRFGTLFIIILSIYFLIKQRHLKTLRKRNKSIMEVNRLAQDLIYDYQSFIKEERKELKKLTTLVNGMESNNISS